DRVVLVDIQVALGAQLQIETAVFGKQLQHVVEEADARRNLVLAAPLDPECAGDARLLGVALEGRPSHDGSTSCSWLMSPMMARACCSRKSAINSECRGLSGAATPMNGTPADRAQRASSTVSPMYHIPQSPCCARIFNRPSGAGFRLTTSCRPMI